MSEELSNLPPPGASVLIVGLTPDVLARTAAILAPHSMEVRTSTLVSLRADATLFKPLVVFIDAYLYDFDPVSFDELATEVGAKLGVISNAKEAEALLARTLRTSTQTPAASADERKSSAPREFDTARYDAKTLHDALQRMGVPQFDEETSSSDASTPRKDRSDS